MQWLLGIQFGPARMVLRVSKLFRMTIMSCHRVILIPDPLVACTTSPVLNYGIYVNLPPTTSIPELDPNWLRQENCIGQEKIIRTVIQQLAFGIAFPGDDVYLVPVTLDDSFGDVFWFSNGW